MMINYVNTYMIVKAILSIQLKTDLISGALCVHERREKCLCYEILVRKTEGIARPMFIFLFPHGSTDLVGLVLLIVEAL